MNNEATIEVAEKENSCDSVSWLTTSPTPVCPNKLDNNDKNDGANETTTTTTSNHPTALSASNSSSSSLSLASFVRDGIGPEICKKVIRAKLAKQRHLVIRQAIDPTYLDTLFPQLLQLFDPQTVHYNGGIAQITEWKISCYLEVMPGGIPTAHPNTALLQLLEPLLEQCNQLFLHWHRQQHACNNQRNSYFLKKRLNENEKEQRRPPSSTTTVQRCKRLMTFVTRYTPQPGEQALLKHVDGAGKVDGSVVVALPMDRWSGPDFAFEGGGLTFWDGRQSNNGAPLETHYDTRSGDVAFIDRAVWHQADPITKGTRWALVIFYKVE